MNENVSHRRRSRLLLGLVAAAIAWTLFPVSAFAIPAWGRKYDVPCSTCHYPAPPRLNVFGHKFRRAQYRMEEEFGKEPDWKKLSDYVSMRIRGHYEYSSAETDPSGDFHTVKSTFRLNDATLFYAGPVTKDFSGFVELERPGDEEIIEAVVSVGGIYGDPGSFATFRLGQFHTLTRVGFGGMDRPTGITTPDALTRDLTAGAGGFSGGTAFKLNQDQVGVEGTYVNGNWRVIGQILNGPRASDSSTTDHADDNQAKDFIGAYELVWGTTASGLTAFAYRGVQDDPAVPDDRIRIQRYGITAAQVFENGFEVQGGFVQAKDVFKNVTPTQEDVRGRGLWVEVEQYFKDLENLTLFARYDQTDPNRDLSDNTRSKITAGLVWPVGGWHARWALELHHIKQETAGGDLSTNEAVAELMLNF